MWATTTRSATVASDRGHGQPAGSPPRSPARPRAGGGHHGQQYNRADCPSSPIVANTNPSIDTYPSGRTYGAPYKLGRPGGIGGTSVADRYQR
jgi:hypothetical protein